MSLPRQKSSGERQAAAADDRTRPASPGVFPDNGAHLRHGVLQLGVYDVGFAVLIDRQHIHRPPEDLPLLPMEESVH